MANITGTAGVDTLQGTNNRDDIFGLGGNDIIIGGLGRDNIDGGTGNDTLDYSNYEGGIGGITGISLEVSETGVISISKGQSGNGDDIVPIGTKTSDNIVNIETIIGNPKKINSIFIFDNFDQTARDGKIDIDFY
jgi:Ca2+-binding RTX toxin-like protein